jgi:hypothetical protein
MTHTTCYMSHLLLQLCLTWRCDNDSLRKHCIELRGVLVVPLSSTSSEHCLMLMPLGCNLNAADQHQDKHELSLAAASAAGTHN